MYVHIYQLFASLTLKDYIFANSNSLYFHANYLMQGILLPAILTLLSCVFEQNSFLSSVKLLSCKQLCLRHTQRFWSYQRVKYSTEFANWHWQNLC